MTLTVFTNFQTITPESQSNPKSDHQFVNEPKEIRNKFTPGLALSTWVPKTANV